jgi:hypothetical protein
MRSLAQDTNGAELYRLSKLYQAPDFVKTASQEDLAPSKVLSAEFYGDPRTQDYPCHTKAATWVHYALFLEQRDRYRPVDANLIEERILDAGRFHDLGRSLTSLKTAVDRHQQPASDDSLADDAFAIVWKNEDGSTERYLPMRHPQETVKAADYLYRHRHHESFTFDVKKEIATSILHKSAEQGVKFEPILGDFLLKQAGLGLCESAEVIDFLSARASMVRSDKKAIALATELVKLAGAYKERPAQLRATEVRQKLAGVVDQFDRATGLHKLVASGEIRCIEDVLFGLTGGQLAKCASEYTSTRTGNVYKLEDVEQLKLSTIRDAMGEDVAACFTKDGLHINSDKAAGAIPALPLPEARLFDRLMTAMDVSPFAKEASSEEVRFEYEWLKEMAASAQTGF